jgi:uncharacterized membrane protein YeaQ/YmgE (transglycosylase-associated protein family)
MRMHETPGRCDDVVRRTGIPAPYAGRAPWARATITVRPSRTHLAKEIIMGIMSIIWMIVVGFIVGLLARFFYPGAVALGFWMTAILGIAGSIVGGLIGGLIWKSPDGRFHPAGFFLSLVGALILLWGYLNFVK